MDVVRRLAALCILIVVAACSASPSPTVVGGTTVTYTGSPPADCAPPKVAEAVRAFLDAFNRGDQQGLRQIFQRSVIFSAQNPPPVGFFLSSGQPSLLEYFAQRHAHSETLELTALHIQYGAASREPGLAPTINRRSDDLAPDVVTAKGAIDCNDRAIILWNQGSYAGRNTRRIPSTARTIAMSASSPVRIVQSM
jgi:hypothetical protein